MNTQSDRITLYIPFLMNHHDRKTITEVFNNHDLGQVDRVDFNTHKDFPDTAYSAFVHFFPYENEKMINIVDELSQNRSVRFDLDPETDPFFGRSEFWILMKSMHTIPDTPKNIHQVMSHVTNLENTIKSLTETITCLSARVKYLEDPEWMDDNELDSPLTMEDLATPNNEDATNMNTHIRFPESDNEDNETTSSMIMPAYTPPRDFRADTMAHSLKRPMSMRRDLSLEYPEDDMDMDNISLTLGSVSTNGAENTIERNVLCFPRINSTEIFNDTQQDYESDATPASMPGLIPINDDVESTYSYSSDDDAMSIDTYSTQEYNDIAQVHPHVDIPSPRPEDDDNEEDNVVDTAPLSSPVLLRQDTLDEMDLDYSSFETTTLIPSWGGNDETLAYY